jgi:arginine decarboxylase
MAALLRELQGHRSVMPAESIRDAYRRLDGLRNEMVELFRRGGLTLEQKAEAERLFWSSSQAINALLRLSNGDPVPPELIGLEPQLIDNYMCNFSVFRSMADHWAIGQRFPIMPVHRLDERPLRKGKLTDLTCDSDGQVGSFVVPSGDKRYLELHDVREGEPYILGVFLMGAYQDIMGDMHNLFGRVSEVHVYADREEPENFYIEMILPGSTVEEQLGLVQYFPNDLERRMNDLIQRKVQAGVVRPRAGVRMLEQYRSLFKEHTYMNTDVA